MGKPSAKSLPGSSPFFPLLLGKPEGFGFLRVEKPVELRRNARVNNHCILFVIEVKAACIKVSRPHCTKASVNHNDLSVVESAFEQPYIAAFFHELVGVVETAVGRQGLITLH